MVLTCMNKFDQEFLNEKLNLEKFVEDFRRDYSIKLNDMQNKDPTMMIAETLKAHGINYDPFYQDPLLEADNGDATSTKGNGGEQSMRDGGTENHSEAPGMAFEEDSQRFDDMKSQKSFRSQGNRLARQRNINKLRFLNGNVEEKASEITKEVREDKDIDLDKIKKALKYNDDQRFLLNYEKIKSGNPQLLNAKDRLAFEKR
jgi:hypothetical protein